MILCSRAWLALVFILLVIAGLIATNSEKDDHLTGRKLSARIHFNREAGVNTADEFDDVLEPHDGGAMDDVDEFEGMEEDIENELADSLPVKLWQRDDLDYGQKEIDYIESVNDYDDGSQQDIDWVAVRREFGKEAEAQTADATDAHLDDGVLFNHDLDTSRTVAQQAQLQMALNMNINNKHVFPLPTDKPLKTAAAAAIVAAGLPQKTTTKANPFNLASFESTPIPPKLSFSDWQSRYQSTRHNDIQDHMARIRGETQNNLHPSVSSPHAYEFTSRVGLGYGAPPENYVAVCVVVRDAHDDIAEWVHYHRKLSISKFYIYDHESTPPLSRVLRPWIYQGIVEYQTISPSNFSQHASKRPQLYGYDKCLQDHGNKHQWLAFIDVDEFLVFQQGPPVQNLPALLQGYENFSALAVHWILFGSAGRDVRPVRGTLRSYPLAVPRNHTYHLYVKTIANTKCTVRTTDSPHVFQHNCTRPAVRTNYSPVHSQTADDLPVHSLLALHHYATRSAQEFEIKMARGSGMKRQRGWDYFYFVDSWSIDYNVAGLQVWDDNVVTLGRTLDPGLLEEQLEKYSKEDHEVFWGKQQGAGSGGGNNKNLNSNDKDIGVIGGIVQGQELVNTQRLAAEQAGKAAVAATVSQAQVHADHWGQAEDVDIEVDEHGGEWDTDFEDRL
ncbi:hypothetical protein Ndes2526B_g04892 [Nannochloris sp. 'desiccata']